MSVDIAKLRALLAAADPLPPSWDVNALRVLMRHGSSSVNGRKTYPNERLDADAALIAAAVNALPEVLDELARLRELADASLDVCVPNGDNNGCGCPPRFYAAREACRPARKAPDADR